MSTLSEFLIAHMPDGWQKTQVVEALAGRLDRATVYKYMAGSHPQNPHDSVLEVFASVLPGVSVTDLRAAVHQPVGVEEPWVPPVEANRLTQAQRRALEAFIKATVAAGADAAAPALVGAEPIGAEPAVAETVVAEPAVAEPAVAEPAIPAGPVMAQSPEPCGFEPRGFEPRGFEPDRPAARLPEPPPLGRPASGRPASGRPAPERLASARPAPERSPAAVELSPKERAEMQSYLDQLRALGQSDLADRVAASLSADQPVEPRPATEPSDPVPRRSG